MDKEFLDNKTETSGCTLEEYIYVYPRLMGKFRQQYDDFDELTFIEREIKNHSIILSSCKDSMEKILDFDYRRKKFDPIEKNYGQEIFLETISYHEKRASSHNAIINYLEIKKTELETKPQTVSAPENKQKTNKSLLFEGKELNLSERFKIANEVLGIDKKIRTLNIQDLEKYQLLAYILGCDKDNARNLMNGSYRSKDRDLLTYFNELGLNK